MWLTRPGPTFETCSSPSVPFFSSTNAPKSVVLTTLPVNWSPTSGSFVSCLDRRDRRVALLARGRVDDGVLARGRRVQLAAELVEDLGDLEGAVVARALEQQVLDEMREAGLGVGLVPRSRADPVPDGSRAHVVEPLGDDALARVELGQPPVLHGRSVVRATQKLANLVQFLDQVRRDPAFVPSAAVDDAGLRVGEEARLDAR